MFASAKACFGKISKKQWAVLAKRGFRANKQCRGMNDVIAGSTVLSGIKCFEMLMTG